MSIVTNIDLRSQGRVAGIYEIRCTEDNGVYVGQSIDLWQRGLKHFSNLRQGSKDGAKRTHHCKRLQQLFNEYGEECFSLNVVFILDKDLVRRINNDSIIRIVLKPLEQFYMNKYEKHILLNGAPAVLSAAGAYSSDFELFHPKLGLVHSNGRCQRQFERDYDIPVGSISMLFAGLTKYTGDFFLSEQDYHEYVDRQGFSVYHPEEGEIKIFRVVDFCEERGLDPFAVYGLISKNKPESVSYRGYFKDKESYERLLNKAINSTSPYTGVERMNKVNCRIRIYVNNKVVYKEKGSDELALALSYQAKRKELGLPEVPLLRMDKLLGKSGRFNQEVA